MEQIYVKIEVNIILRKIIYNITIEKTGIFTECFNKNILIWFNTRRGMFNYTDTSSGTICISFDNSAEIYSFFKNLNVLNSTDIANLYTYYVPYASDTSFFYNSTQFAATYLSTTYTVKDVYFGGEILRPLSTGRFVQDEKFFMYDKGPFGECMKAHPVRFNLDIKNKNCAFKIVT